MPKVKSKLVTAVVKGYANIVGRRLPTFQSDVYFREVAGKTIMSLKPKQPKRSKSYSTFLNWLWCIVDLMYRGMTLGKFNQWKRFYWWARDAGLTVKGSVERATKTKITGYKKNMGYYAFFMKKGLTWDLEKYFSDYLKAKWRINSCAWKDEVMEIEAEIVHKELVWIPREPRILKVERVRL